MPLKYDEVVKSKKRLLFFFFLMNARKDIWEWNLVYNLENIETLIIVTKIISAKMAFIIHFCVQFVNFRMNKLTHSKIQSYNSFILNKNHNVLSLSFLFFFKERKKILNMFFKWCLNSVNLDY